ncbi:hypothetical protein D9M72_559930 [compost metagenome]
MNRLMKSTSAPKKPKAAPVRLRPAAVVTSPAKVAKNARERGCATSQKILESRNIRPVFFPAIP